MKSFSTPSCFSPARQLDGVNVQGFYVWKLQDRNVPQFGLFTSSHHQSRAKASLNVYREIIHRGGFPAQNNTQDCRAQEQREPCLTCEWMFKNKAMLVFGGCLLITAAMLASLVISVIITKRNQTLGRGRGIIRRQVPPKHGCYAGIAYHLRHQYQGKPDYGQGAVNYQDEQGKKEGAFVLMSTF